MIPRWLAPALAALVVATGCTSSDGAESAAEPTVAPPEPTTAVVDESADEPTSTTASAVAIEADPGVLVWVHEREPPNLNDDDPDNLTDIAAWIRQGLTEGLFGIDAGNAFYPELLAGEPELERLNSGTVVIRYRLRNDLRWSDGTPLTAADVAYTHGIVIEGCQIENDRSIVDASNEGCEYEMASRQGYELVTDFEVVSDTEFNVTMASFFPGWRVMYDRVMAAHAYGGTARDVNDNLVRFDDGSGPLPSSGPLRLERWEEGSALELASNEDYHGSVSPDSIAGGPPTIDGVQVVFVADLDARIELLSSGQADLIMTNADLRLGVLTASEGFTVASTAGPTYEHWSLNLLNPHLAKPGVREAIAYAIDKEEIVAQLYEPLLGPVVAAEGLGSGFWMPNQAAYEDHQRRYAGHNSDAATLALSTAGYQQGADGTWSHPVDGPLRLRAGTTGGVELRDRQLDLIAEQLGRVGIEIDIGSAVGGQFFTEGPFAPEALEASVSDGRNGDGDLWDIAQFSWTSGPWPGVVSGVFRSESASNPYAYNNPEYDVAATDCDAVADDAERAGCYDQLDRFVTTLDRGDDGLVIIPLTQRPRFYGYGESVQTGAIAPDVVRGGPLVNAADWVLGAQVTNG